MFQIGFFNFWLTLPVLWIAYLRLARAEERDALDTFGDAYRKYMSKTGRFLPWIGRVAFRRQEAEF